MSSSRTKFPTERILVNLESAPSPNWLSILSPDRSCRASDEKTPRANSPVENLNSRLRNYFFLRRTLGNDYLDLLRFVLNHRTFLRSEHPEREGKSPTELLTRKPHAHRLELLGFDLFQQPAIVT